MGVGEGFNFKFYLLHSKIFKCRRVRKGRQVKHTIRRKNAKTRLSKHLHSYLECQICRFEIWHQ